MADFVGQHVCLIHLLLKLTQYSTPRLNDQRLSSHFLAVKTGWPIIRANLMQIGHLVFEKTGQ